MATLSRRGDCQWRPRIAAENKRSLDGVRLAVLRNIGDLPKFGAENAVYPIGAKEAAAAFLEGCTYDLQTQTECVLDLALEVWREVSMLHLACRPDESAVACLERALR